jgi:hypothetical protein
METSSEEVAAVAIGIVWRLRLLGRKANQHEHRWPVIRFRFHPQHRPPSSPANQGTRGVLPAGGQAFGCGDAGIAGDGGTSTLPRSTPKEPRTPVSGSCQAIQAQPRRQTIGRFRESYLAAHYWLSRPGRFAGESTGVTRRELIPGRQPKSDTSQMGRVTNLRFYDPGTIRVPLPA